MKQKLHKASGLSIALLALTSSTVHAIDLKQEYNSPFTKQEHLGGLVSIVIANAGVIAGLVFLVLVISAGFTMVHNAGGDPQKFAKGRDIITFALVGFLIIFAAYWIIQIIELMTGTKIV